MSDEPMRTLRSSGRVPGFAQPSASPSETTPGLTSRSPMAPAALDPRAGTRQLNVRVLAPLLARYKRLVRDLEDEGFETSTTELVHALLHLLGHDHGAEMEQRERIHRQ